MKVQRRHLHIAIAVLVLAIGWNLWSFFKPATRTTPLQQPQAPLLQAEAAGAGGPEAAAIDPVSIPAPPEVPAAAAPALTRDPFLFGDETRDARTQAASDEPAPDPVVRTILVSPTRRTAIVNSRMVSVGDAVGTLKVVEIERDAVVFANAAGARRRVALHRAPPPGLTR
jgi:hypothetical protein